MTTPLRKPHAHMDLASRRWKGMKIERLLEMQPGPPGRRLLEIGTGSGGIAAYFAAQEDLHLQVEAVDVVDARSAVDGYRFTRVDGVQLPFADSSFDFVISNHVIEHVGDRDQQRAHLAEISRVLKPAGMAYLSVPNRWMLVEPHYGLAFLSWLPHWLRTPYLRARGRGMFYDCEPLQLPQLESMLRGSGLAFDNVGVRALRLVFEIERPGSRGARLLRHLPDGLIECGRRLNPTLIHILRRVS